MSVEVSDMGQSARAVLQLMLLGLSLATILVWTGDTVNWPARILCPLGAIGTLSILLWAALRRDRAPDFLKAIVGRYFERKGFCFAVVPRTISGRFVLDLYFQNRYARPCQARVLLYAAPGLLSSRRKLKHIGVEIECDGGAFGVMHIPWAIPQEYQGKNQVLDVGANVKYRNGRGGTLRFSEGCHVGDANVNALTRPLAAGRLLLSGLGIPGGTKRPASMNLRLPQGVDDTGPEDTRYVVETLWRPGDPHDLDGENKRFRIRHAPIGKHLSWRLRP